MFKPLWQLGADDMKEIDVDEALIRLFGGQETPVVASKGSSVDVTGTSATLAKEAMSIYERAIHLQRQGDWTGYGEEVKRLGKVLQQMAE